MKTETIRRIKKADTYGDRDDWQVHENTRAEIEDYLNKNNIEYIHTEEIDSLIAALEKLGYIKFEEELK